MTARLTRPRSARSALARAAALVAVVGATVACSGGGDDSGAAAVPTLLTAPIQPSSTSTTTSTVPGTDPADSTAAEPAATTAPTSTVADPAVSTSAGPPGDTAGTPSGPGAASTSSTSGSAGTSSSNPGTSSTSSTADIEPPPSTPPPTAPVPTAAQPPDTIGGGEADFALAPRSIAGLQFGASRTTVLNRLTDLLGDPLDVVALPACPGGPATAYQWFNAGVIISDRGLAYYEVGMDLDTYGELPIPNWRTAAGIAVGATQADLDAAYPGQITYGTPIGQSVPFTVTGGSDAGLGGQLHNAVLQSLSAGTTTC